MININYFINRIVRREPKPEPCPVPTDGLSWEFATVWNQSLLTRPEFEPRRREHIWASEIGNPFIDRYLKMTGVAPTNGPNARSKRKFEAADIFEWLVGFVLKQAGIWIESQEKLNFQYPGLLRVTGKLDHLAGGRPDWSRARRQVSAVGLPRVIERASLAIIDRLSGMYGDDVLRTIVLEVKSLSTFMFDRYEATRRADTRHEAQAFHYLKAKALPEAHIAYICRDDCRIVELGVFNPSSVEQAYRRDIELMTSFVSNGVYPEKEQELLFDESRFRFSTNWGVEYSAYLTYLYGYDEPIHYREKWKKTVDSMNRVFKRCVVDAKMTDKNLLVLEVAHKLFPRWDEMIALAKEVAKANPAIIEEEAA
jgi:hypothetical protein